MIIAEREKFTLLSAIIRELGYRLTVKRRTLKAKSKRQRIDGESDIHNQHVYIYLPMKMSLADWSEATAVLFHEYGHVYNYTFRETEAWANADKLRDRFPCLEPLNYTDVKISDLENYKGRIGSKTDRTVFNY